MLTSRVDGSARSEGGRIAELYLAHADAAVRLAYLLTGDAALAEDLVQDAFVRVAGRLTHLRDPGSFDAYLRRTVVNLTRSHLRRRKVERLYLQRARGEIGSKPAESPGTHVEDREQLWHAMARLSERQRAAIVLRFYEDLSEAQVADVLRCRPGTVKSLVSRGLTTLRNEIRGEER
jgi:RNA polymerase sigma-70 factor (sigma-E family)